jgi:hypothetical protein
MCLLPLLCCVRLLALRFIGWSKQWKHWDPDLLASRHDPVFSTALGQNTFSCHLPPFRPSLLETMHSPASSTSLAQSTRAKSGRVSRHCSGRSRARSYPSRSPLGVTNSMNIHDDVHQAPSANSRLTLALQERYALLARAQELHNSLNSTAGLIARLLLRLETSC